LAIRTPASKHIDAFSVKLSNIMPTVLHWWPSNPYCGKTLQHSWLPIVMSFCCLYTSSVYKQQRCLYRLLAQLHPAFSPLTSQVESFITKLSQNRCLQQTEFCIACAVRLTCLCLFCRICPRMLHCLCYEAQLLVPVLQNLTKDTALFRPVIVNQVLGTDMKKHFDITSRFQVGLLQPMLCLSFSAGYVRPSGHALPVLLSRLCSS
jgi:hypothetical protein